jgi:adenosylcobinamide kinase / adenosylcobinamide-phosphate guanylyltransferase
VAKIVLVVGGCRSGKSAYAEALGRAIAAPRAFVATCPVTDAEMQRRIDAHRQARRDHGWETIEEQLDLARVFREHREHGVLLVDCVTLWVNNLMYYGENGSETRLAPALVPGGPDTTVRAKPSEADIARQCIEMLDAAAACRGTIIFVSNEVGMGIVPATADVRRYRDLVGRANQSIAARADAVTLVSCGIPLPLKECA